MGLDINFMEPAPESWQVKIQRIFSKGIYHFCYCYQVREMNMVH